MPIETKILFVTDIHGSETVFRKALNAAKMFPVDYLILGGDLFSKDFILILRKGNFYYAGEEEIGLNELYNNYKISGLAPLIFDKKEEIDEFLSNKAYRKEKILDFLEGQIEEWVKIFNEKTGNSNFITYWNTGNDDPLEVDDKLKKHGIEVVEDKVVNVGDLLMVSCGYVNPTPWNTYRELPESTLFNRLQDKLKKISESIEGVIFNFHAPPYNTKLDLAKMEENQRKHVGSTTIREIIEKHQPILSLHGHIHESAGIDNIGKTKVVNPGSEYKEGILNYAYIVIKKESKGFGRLYLKSFNVKTVHLGKG